MGKAWEVVGRVVHEELREASQEWWEEEKTLKRNKSARNYSEIVRNLLPQSLAYEIAVFFTSSAALPGSAMVLYVVRFFVERCTCSKIRFPGLLNLTDYTSQFV